MSSVGPLEPVQAPAANVRVAAVRLVTGGPLGLRSRHFTGTALPPLILLIVGALSTGEAKPVKSHVWNGVVPAPREVVAPSTVSVTLAPPSPTASVTMTW